MPHRSVKFLSINLLLVLAAATASASDWPQYRGSDRDAISDEKVVTWPPSPLWSRLASGSQGIGNGYASVAICQGSVYAIGHQPGGGVTGTDTVYALNADTGAVRWTYSYASRNKQGNFGGGSTPLPPDAGEFGPRATPATDGVYVFTVSLDGHIFCLSADTGRVVWYRNLESHLGGTLKGYGAISSPLLYGNWVIMDIGGACVALAKSTGALAWKAAGGRGVWSGPSPALAWFGGTPHVLFGGRDLVAARAADGGVAWQYDMGREALTSPLVAADKIFFSTYPDSGACAALRGTTAGRSVLWQASGSAPNCVKTYHLSNIAYNGYIFAMDNSGTEWSGTDSSVSSLKCIKLDDGALQWTKTGMGWASPVLAGGDLLMLKDNGVLVRAPASPAAYVENAVTVQAVAPRCWTAPALADGRLYCRNYFGDLVALSVAPCVSVTASDPLACQNPVDTGEFTIRRVAPDISAALDVSVSISGPNGEFTTITSPVTIPAGRSSVTVPVETWPDFNSQDDDVTLTIVSGTYVIGSPSSAKVRILRQVTTVPVVTVSAPHAWTLEGGPGSGTFVVNIAPALPYDLPVQVSVTGTAAASTYFLGGTDGVRVTIPAGAMSGTVTVQAGRDANAVDDTVVLTAIASGTYYTVGAPASATITISDIDRAMVDTDGDGMDDGWERSFFGDLSQTAAGDYTGGGVTNLYKYQHHLDPTRRDTDGDSCDDAVEIAHNTDPADPLSFFVTTPPSGTPGPGVPTPNPPLPFGCATASYHAFGAGLAAILAVLGAALLRRRYHVTNRPGGAS
jgi:outer membrane protein assembly factor BamB